VGGEIGVLFGVASKIAAAGETVTIATGVVFDLPNPASAIIAAGRSGGLGRCRDGSRGQRRDHRSRAA
jgi:predicted RecA/RadA family phage recombinase